MDFTNYAISTTGSEIVDATTSFTIPTADASKFPTANFIMTVWGSSYLRPRDDVNVEIIECTRSGSTITIVTRAMEGTTQVDHVAGSWCGVFLTAGILNDLRDLADASFLPAMAGESGKILTTNGTIPVWSSTIEPTTFQPSTDAVAVTLQNSASQTVNLLEVKDYAGTVLLNIGPQGHIGVGNTAGDTVSIIITETTTETSGAIYGINCGVFGDPASSSSANYLGFMATARIATANAQNFTGVWYGLSANVRHLGTGTATTMRGGDFQVLSTGGGTITTGAAIVVNTPTISGAGSAITNNYGIYVGNISGGTTINSSITTNAGDVVFNEGGDSLSDFRVESDTYDALFVDASDNSVMVMSNIAGKVGFYGVTAVAQRASAAQAAAPAGGTGATAGAYDTAAHRNSMIDLVNEMRTVLVNLGLMKGSA